MDYVYILKTCGQILILSWLLYRFYEAVNKTRAVQIIRIVFFCLAVYFISYILNLRVFLKIFQAGVLPFCFLLFILYQPELRRAFTSEFSMTRFLRKADQTSGEQIDVILNACSVLSSQRRGALIVFKRQLDLKGIIDTGTKINADVSSSLILTIFDHDTPLHDGAIIIQGGTIIAAGCYLPLSDQTEIKRSFGTRHRAALGLVEESDAVVLIVSEEKGAISLAYNHNIYYDLETEEIKRTLLALFNYQDEVPEVLGGEGNNENTE